MPDQLNIDFQLCKQRRQELCKQIKQRHSVLAQNGIVLLLGDFEQDCVTFKQERSFYYLTGVQEPASSLIINLEDEKTTLFVPNFGQERSKWMADAIMPTPEQAHKLHIDAIEYIGLPCKGYQCHPFFSPQEYETLLQKIQQWVNEKRTIFTCNPSNTFGYVMQRFILQRIAQTIPDFLANVVDISPLIAQLRRKKHNREIELLYKAVDITIQAHEVAAHMIKPDRIEYEVQAGIEYTFIVNGGSVAFPSIVGSGKNATILHYHHNNKKIEQQDLVVVDIGAEYGYYCADLTRTYPASGTFNKRQRELYQIVLETQEFIAQQAKPGMWVTHQDQQDKSLNHLAREFLKERGYAQYFLHGIGHFLGLEVHDVGDHREPLQVGDVITIEPGIYLAQENIGIRIEDDYWIVQDGSVSLSENLPKTADDIEAMMQEISEDTHEEHDA